MPLLGKDPVIRRHLEAVCREISPRAILVVSAHWEANPVRVSGGLSPDLYFDYYGFPPESYEYTYKAPGDPDLAQRVQRLLADDGIGCELDSKRGLDHGVFVPLMLAYPKADVPVVALSLHASLDPEKHLAIGRALRPLRDDGVLILCSGMSFHNMRAFRMGGAPARRSIDFDDALAAAVLQPDAAQRRAQLANWRALPEAAFAHPREEHLLPLMVAAGASSDGTMPARLLDASSMGAKLAAYRFD
ncbi:hypothetical protein CTAYLR_000956 [Chrysophaeum taylorii]|uniref:Extradiol ring-cleavage dioxygenase class III enzyme subunit B domain-containing protein n=1 Tax=Chrysophaeum taylorii TaxID=2483200 RepID=A0AAD7UGS5_9STRA|nr:hypothetical protein CTAYLR_000956 [Chrysophaeum taylorii]